MICDKIICLYFKKSLYISKFIVILVVFIKILVFIETNIIMKPEKQKRVDDIVETLSIDWLMTPKDNPGKKLEKQIRKIAGDLVDDISRILKKKVSKEEKCLVKELKHRNKENRIRAAKQILSSKTFLATLEV